MTERFGTICRVLMTAMAMTAAVAGAAQNAPPAQAPPAPCGPNLTGVKNVAPDSRCFELRTYTVQPDSPGSLDMLHARFRDSTVALFKKHGMTVVGFWHPTNKPDALVYLLAYKDRAARDAEWAAFNADPEWVKVRTDMNVKVQVDSVFMSATDYSPMK